LASNKDLPSGLGWTDVMDLIRAVESIHNVDVSLTISLDGAYTPGRLQVVAVASQRVIDTTGRKRSVSRKRFWPSYDAKAVEGLAFRLLHELDADCGAMWVQATLPE